MFEESRENTGGVIAGMLRSLLPQKTGLCKTCYQAVTDFDRRPILFCETVCAN